LYSTGLLPDSYQKPFCHPAGVDGQFLSFFNISKEEILKICPLSDLDIQKWFLEQKNTSPERIEKWNLLSINLGKPGYPMSERFEVALSSSYKNIAHLNPKSVFEALEADERHE